MRHCISQMSPARRQQILDESRAAGRLGALRLPTITHAEPDELSDTLLLAALTEFEAGAAERPEEDVK